LVLSILLTLAYAAFGEFSAVWWEVVLYAGLSFLVSFVVIQFFLSKDLYRRLLPIYRTITGMTSKAQSPFNDGVMNMPIEDTERRVEDWADARIEEIRSLQARDDFRREFIGNMAHELKTPLFNVQGFVSSLIEGAVEDEKVRERFLQKALNNVQRMTRIIDDLDAISHLEAGRLEMDLAPMDILKTAKDIADGMEKKAEGRSVKMKVKGLNPIMVSGDEFRIGQVFTNLFSNAITYGKTGGTVEVNFTDFEDRVLVEVSDDGPGIAPDKLPRIFERFYRVDMSRSRNVGGTGLGLAIVKHIIEAHGQSVSAKSDLGHGATFSFALPKAR